jgi:hypothetical protein
MIAHTPGPWAWTYDGSSTYSIGPSKDPQERSVATIFEQRDARAMANAHLIAAAPDLYAALRDLVECARNWISWANATEWVDFDEESALRDSRAALAKADGKA